MPKERDYAREWQTEKARQSNYIKVTVKLTKQENADFDAKCAMLGTTKNAVLRSYVQRYTYQDFDQEIN